MLKQAIVTLIGFLAIASAFNATFEDSLFSVAPENELSYTLFQTQGGIIAYHIDIIANTNNYMLVNLETKSVSVILSDIVAACNNAAANYDRLHYHVATSSLLYYCVKNNSLLIIDQTTYAVELTIPTNINTTFDEVKLVPQGYSLAVLGMIAVFTDTPSTSELITFDLQSHTVANHVVFNYGLNSREAVVGYAASSKNSLYILTSTCVSPYEYEVTLYSMFLIGNSYTINNITSRNYTLSFPYYPIMTELYSVGNLLVMSYNKIVDIASAQGNVLGTVPGLAVNSYLSLNNVQHVALTAQYGNSDFYALLQNGTLLKFNVQNAGYNVETFATDIQDMHYVTSNISSSSLLFTMDELYLFNITDLQTSQPIYSTIAGATDFMTTDTTYAVTVSSNQNVVYVFNRETNLLIYQGQVGENYFYDANSDLISYIEYTNSSQTQCHMVQFNIQTTNSYVPFVLDPSYGTDCPKYYFFNVTNDLDNPQFLLNVGGTLLVMSKKFGLLKYGSFDYSDENIPFVDYDTLTVYVAAAQTQVNNDVKIFVSIFNSNNNTFIFQNSTSVGGGFTIYNLYALPGKFVIGGISSFELVDLSATLNKTVVNGSIRQPSDFFQDKTGAIYLIVSYYDVYYVNQVTELPGTTASTRDGSSAGLCRYALRDQINSFAFTVIRFFNVCSQEVLSPEIYV